MYTRTSRRVMILIACLAGMACWAGLGQAAPLSITVQLSGAQQVPPVQTSATGKADLTYDPTTRVVTWAINCEGLSGPVTMAHFHVTRKARMVPWRSG
jgi:CHRD domain